MPGRPGRMAFRVVAAAFARWGALEDAVRWGIAFNRNYVHEGPGLAWAAGRLGLQLVGVEYGYTMTEVGQD